MTTQETLRTPELRAVDDYLTMSDTVFALRDLFAAQDIEAEDKCIDRITLLGNDLAGTQDSHYVMGVNLRDKPASPYDNLTIATRVMHAFTAQYIVNRVNEGSVVMPRVMGAAHMTGIANELVQQGVFPSLRSAYGTLIHGIEVYGTLSARKPFRLEEKVYAGAINGELKPKRTKERLKTLAKGVAISVGIVACGKVLSKTLGKRKFEDQ